MVSASTMKRLFSAKSTSPRMVSSPQERSNQIALLLHRALQDQRVADNLVARLYARNDFLHLVGEVHTGGDRDAMKFVFAGRHVDPIAVVQMQNRRGQNRRMRL